MGRIATGGCLLVLALLGACTGVVPVKTVMADKPAYLEKNFSTLALSPSLVAQIQAADNKPIGFQKMVVTANMHVINGPSSPTTTPPALKLVTTLVNAGAPFVERLDESYSNDLLINDLFSLTYRSLLPLRSQDIKTSAAQSDPMFQVREFISFVSVSNAAPDAALDYVAAAGPIVQQMNFQHIGFKCVGQGPVAANTINSALNGQGRKYHCQFINASGVAVQNFDAVYLDTYGITITTHFDTSTVSYDYEIAKVEIQ